MGYRIGIDAGSKTIKVVVVDEHGTLVHSLYRRHRSDIKTTLAEALHDLAWRHGDLEGTVGVTGSAGIGVAELLGLPFVQEVIATTHAVQCAYPEADAIIELGGEDAKVVYLTGGLEQRMNATCAGGTGGFIDTMAFMLGTSSKNMSSLALGANRIYPIASRCAVFAQTDVRPLLNAGARTSDLAASALEAVVRQTLGGLACGRPIKGTVVFLGGPLEHIPDLVQRFRTALGISHKEGIKPPDAHLFTAMGAALVAAEEAETKQKARGTEGEPEAGEPREALDAEGGPEAGTPEVGAARGMRGAEGTAEAGTAKVEAPEAGTPRDPHDSSRAFVHSLSELEERVRQATNPENDLVRLPPLFASEDELREFRTRHEGARMERVRLFDCTGPIYLGLDAGSTAVKLAVLDEAGRLAYSDYHATDGDALKTAADMLADLFVALPRSANGTPYAHIAHATVTGYGEDLLRAGLGIDSGVVETLAHVRAAQQFQPDLTFLLDIGGQDMKAIWVRDGRVANAVLNEACSSGCGSFIEGTAHSLRSTPYRFAAAALEAREPVDLGTKCTVFMTSRVRHAQKIGVETQDIAAGIAYSVVKNALFRIIGMSQLDSLGPHVVVQGGAFMSDAVLRAFELVGGIEAVRPDTAHLMGAIGAALTARLRANTLRKEGGAPKSSLVGAQELAALDPRRTAMRCTGCENVCALSIVEFATGRRFISGNRCDRAQACVERALKEKARTRSVGAGAMGAYTGARNAVPAGERTGAQAAAPSPDSARLPGKDAADPAPAGTHAGASDDVPASNMPPARAAQPTESRPPNAIALEQKLLARFGDVLPDGQRGSACIGLPGVLAAYEQGPFWHTLFATLGFSLRVADDRRAEASSAAREGIGTIPSESVCFPAKLAHMRLHDLARQGVAAVFMPRYARGNRCPVTSLYASALADSVPLLRDAACQLASPELSIMKPSGLCDSDLDRAALLACLNGLATRADVPSVSEDELVKALADGLAAQRDFEDAVRRANERALAWTRHAGRRAAVLAGRPYHADPALLHGIDRVLVDVGFAVLSPLGLEDALAAEPCAAACAEPCAEPPRDPLSWKPGKRLVRLARMVAENPQLELVCLQSFGCGFDAISLAHARTLLNEAGRPFTALKIDDIADTAHIRIRLRTLAETLEAEPFFQTQERAGHASIRTEGGAPARPILSATAFETDAAPAPQPSDDMPDKQSPRPLLGGVEQVDLDTAQQSVPNDACFVVSALAGRAIRLMKEDPALASLEIPAVCERCLLDALPAIVRQATGREPRIDWTTTWPSQDTTDTSLAAETSLATVTAHALHAPLAAGTSLAADISPTDTSLAAVTPPQDAARTLARPRIGIVGNALLCFDPFMNDHVVRFIESQGCDVVLPDPSLLYTDDVRYLAQFDRFAAQGVHHVIYLQSFGCLKGHVQARGALHMIAKRHPGLPVTVIDYDPEASALNRENRVRLALSAAKAAVSASSGAHHLHGQLPQPRA